MTAYNGTVKLTRTPDRSKPHVQSIAAANDAAMPCAAGWRRFWRTFMEIRFLNGRDDLSDAFFVRDEVFTKEQGFTIPDADAFDAISDHMIVYIDGKPAATGRVYRDEHGAFHIGRIAVLKQYRGRQLGRLLMDRLEAAACEQGAEKIVLGAQLYAVPFYEKCGFTGTGERFFEEFCEHETLVKTVTPFCRT
ncbi:GNAT family N-acetyltransferase [Anaerotruncus colihominis]|uniref:GNAT family N-acetyltransferase n=2 Tax=Anaerotruncus colihominis TaxID=169435 RepID=A0A845RJE3_9FIRM|nr:GNAT family N-acetyltransferase [Anaerotruncus colihominis]